MGIANIQWYNNGGPEILFSVAFIEGCQQPVGIISYDEMNSAWTAQYFNRLVKLAAPDTFTRGGIDKAKAMFVDLLATAVEELESTAAKFKNEPCLGED